MGRGAMIITLATSLLGCGVLLGITEDPPEPPPSQADAAAATEAGSAGGSVDPCAGVDTNVDPDNCGACGRSCKAGEACLSGACVADTCGGPTASRGCADGDGGLVCVDMKSDERHCGSCGRRCNLGSCNEGECERLVFITSAAYPASAFGGVAGADAECQSLAGKARLHGTFKAWISDGEDSPSKRFVKGSTAYRLMDGKVVAVSWKTLINDGPLQPISIDEHGVSVPKARVWTSTKADGTPADQKPCGVWTTSSESAVTIGRTGEIDGHWTETPGDCESDARLYCFEQ